MSESIIKELDINSTNSPLEIYNYLNKLRHNKNEYLQYHQLLVHNYFINFPHSRGLLINHSVGTGKTILASSLAIYFASQGRKVIVLAAKSLQDNFKSGVQQYLSNTLTRKNKNNESIKEINSDDFIYISLNSNNVLDQVSRIDQNQANKKFEKSLGELSEIIRRDNKLNDALLIIDEAHNLSNGISNGSKNAVGLYDLILKAKNLKLLLLTGTPIVNDSFEIGILFNMVKGYIKNGAIVTTLFPEIRDEFINYFVDKKKMIIKNSHMFSNRVYGLSTYYGPFYNKLTPTLKTLKRKGYPDEYEIIMEYVPMSSEQFSRYSTFRDKEKKETATGYRPTAYSRFEKRSGSSTYRIATRQISNYVIPTYALGETHGLKARVKYINKITPKDLNNLDKFSPKFKRIIYNINKHPGISVVHSDFVTGEGINLFAKILNQQGYKEWKPTTQGGYIFNNMLTESYESNNTSNSWQDITEEINEWYQTDSKYEDDTKYGGFYDDNPNINETYFETVDNIDNLTFYGGKDKRYAILTGDVDPEDRTKILLYINSKENKNGDLVKILLISSAGSEGISVYNARSIHLMNPTWNYASINQIKARVIRYKSHENLPTKNRNVQPYIYLSDYPDGYVEQWKKKNKQRVQNKLKPEILEPTTDIILMHRSIKQKKLNDYFLASSIRASIDCSIHTSKMSKTEQDRIKCLMCSPTNTLLYHPSIATQLKLPNPCVSHKQEKVKAKEIIINLDNQQLKFYYLFDKDNKEITVLEYNENLDGYVPLSSDHIYYSQVYSYLENKLL